MSAGLPVEWWVQGNLNICLAIEANGQNSLTKKKDGLNNIKAGGRRKIRNKCSYEIDIS